MTANSKRLAILLGEAVMVVAIDYAMSVRPEQQDPDVALHRRRYVWLHALASEALSFMIDEVIRQRQRAEVALDRAAAAATLPAQASARLHLPQQSAQAEATPATGRMQKARPAQA